MDNNQQFNEYVQMLLFSSDYEKDLGPKTVDDFTFVTNISPKKHNEHAIKCYLWNQYKDYDSDSIRYIFKKVNNELKESLGFTLKDFPKRLEDATTYRLIDYISQEITEHPPLVSSTQLTVLDILLMVIDNEDDPQSDYLISPDNKEVAYIFKNKKGRMPTDINLSAKIWGTPKKGRKKKC